MANIDVLHEYVDAFWGTVTNEMDESASTDKPLFPFNFKDRKGDEERNTIK